MDRYRGWSCTGDSSGTGLGPGVPGLCREPGPAPAPGLLPAGALGHGATVTGRWPWCHCSHNVWPQPQKPVAMGATLGLPLVGLTGRWEPPALGPGRCVAWGSSRTPSHPGMHLPRSARAPSILPHLWEPLCGSQCPGFLALAMGRACLVLGSALSRLREGAPTSPGGS